jgi:hypothetical protein
MDMFWRQRGNTARHLAQLPSTQNPQLEQNTMAPSINEKTGGLAECDEHAAKDGTLVSQPITYIDPAEEKALVKKLDRVIMPVMAVVYFFQCKHSSSPSPKGQS